MTISRQHLGCSPQNHLHMQPHQGRCTSLLSLSMTLLMLTACGGSDKGTIGGASDSAEVLMLAGTEKIIPGTIETTKNLIKSMTWQIAQVNGQNAQLSTKNSECAVTDKNDFTVPNATSTASQPLIGGSAWTCYLTVTSATNVVQDAVYSLMLTAVDSAGASITFKKTLRVQPNQAFSPAANALSVSIAGSLLGKPGQVLSIGGVANWQNTASTAQKNQSIFYTWTLDSSAPAGTTILSPNNPTTQLYLPLQPATTTLVPLTLTATSGANIATTSATVVIEPSAKVSPIIIPPVQQCGTNQTAFIRIKDIDPAHPNLIYQWTVDPVPGALPIEVGGANTSSAGFITPVVTSPTLMTVRFAASSNPISSGVPSDYTATALVQVMPGMGSCQPISSTSLIPFPGY